MLQERLKEFAKVNRFSGAKGPLCVALVVTDHARLKGLPLDADNLLTAEQGQVLGLGKSAVQAILKRHGIDRVLAEEGGRTSRGSIKKMRTYVALLNELHVNRDADLDYIERFWITEVEAFFSGKPFKIKLDSSHSLRRMVRDLLDQAIARQKKSTGMNYAGVVLQHLVGAKLEAALKDIKIEHNSASTADAPSGRKGDFLIHDVAIHVTTNPGEGVLAKCKENLDQGLRPILVTICDGLTKAEVFAESKGIIDRLDIFEIEQFMALNIYEIGGFSRDGRRDAVHKIVEAYNIIIDAYETDPSLRIEAL